MLYRSLSSMSIASVGLVNVDGPRFTQSCLHVQWIIVRHGRVTLVEVVPNKIVSSSNLVPSTKTSAKVWVSVVDARVDTASVNNESRGHSKSETTEIGLTGQFLYPFQ